MVHRVFVTGMGVASPLGINPGELFDALNNCRSGAQERPGSPERRMPPWLAAAVTEDCTADIPKMTLTQIDRVGVLGLHASLQAVNQSGLAFGQMDHERCALSWGTCMGGAGSVEDAYESFIGTEQHRMAPLTVVKGMTNSCAAQIAMRFTLQGPMLAISNACASSAQAIGEGMRMLRSGAADVVIAGGAEAFLVPGVVRAWQALGVLARPDEADPARSCKPFDLKLRRLNRVEGALPLRCPQSGQCKCPVHRLGQCLHHQIPPLPSHSRPFSHHLSPYFIDWRFRVPLEALSCCVTKRGGMDGER
jgi:3-oxoacyl-[acyl-carrier-protein] synthase II